MLGREIYRLMSSEETNTRLEQVGWKGSMFLTVVNMIFIFIFPSSGVTHSSRILVPSAECLSKSLPCRYMVRLYGSRGF